MIPTVIPKIGFAKMTRKKYFDRKSVLTAFFVGFNRQLLCFMKIFVKLLWDLIALSGAFS